MPDALEDIVKRVNQLESQISRLAVDRQKYEILNMTENLTLTADQNAWDIQNRDVIFVQGDAARTVNGIANGVAGRLLWLRVTGSFGISFTHQNAAAVDADKIITPSAATVTVTVRHWAIFIYGDGVAIPSFDRWIMVYPPA